MAQTVHQKIMLAIKVGKSKEVHLSESHEEIRDTIRFLVNSNRLRARLDFQPFLTYGDGSVRTKGGIIYVSALS